MELEYLFKPPPRTEGEDSTAGRLPESFIGKYQDAWTLLVGRYRGWTMFVEFSFDQMPSVELEYLFRPPASTGEDSADNRMTKSFVGWYPEAWKLFTTTYDGWQMFVEVEGRPPYRPKPLRKVTDAVAQRNR